jgi:hypothetical protein
MVISSSLNEFFVAVQGLKGTLWAGLIGEEIRV